MENLDYDQNGIKNHVGEEKYSDAKLFAFLQQLKNDGLIDEGLRRRLKSLSGFETIYRKVAPSRLPRAPQGHGRPA